MSENRGFFDNLRKFLEDDLDDEIWDISANKATYMPIFSGLLQPTRKAIEEIDDTVLFYAENFFRKLKANSPKGADDV